MRILAIDTATSYGGVAVYDDSSGRYSECRGGGVHRQFSESIIEMTDLCLKNMSMSMHDLDCLAVTKGPGSFTGLRVGLSAVKGLAYAAGKPVIAVSTLLAHAWTVPWLDADICPILDARKREVYAALFRRQGDEIVPILAEGAYPIEQVLRHIDRPTVFLGDGIAAYRQRIGRVCGHLARFVSPVLQGGFPSVVAFAAVRMAARGEYADIATLAPEYFRKSEAELALRREHDERTDHTR